MQPLNPKHVTIETGSSGLVVLVEPKCRKGSNRRVFRQVGMHYEWAHFDDWRSNGERAHFHKWNANELPKSMTY